MGNFALGTALLKTGVDLSGLTTGLGQASTKIQNTTKAIDSAGRLMMGLGAPLVAVGAASLKVAVDFDKSMRNVNAIAGLGESAFADLRDEVVEFSLKTRASTKDVADSLYNVVNAGYSLEAQTGEVSDAMQIMQISASAAGAGLATTADTSRLLISTLKSYNLTAGDSDHVTDLFLKTVQTGLTTLPELASSLGKVMPIASQTGISLEELGFTMAQATSAGLDTANATVYLRNMLTSFLSPSDEMSEALEKMGYTSGVTAIKEEGLAGVMRQLRDLGYDNAEALRALFPRTQGMTVAMSLMNSEAFMSVDAFAQFKEGIDGTRDAMKEEQYKSLSAQLARLKSVFEAVGVEIGTKFIPVLVELIQDWVPKLREFFMNLDTDAVASAIKVGALFVAVGTGLTILAKLITIGATVVTTLKAMYEGLVLVKAGFSIAQISSLGLTTTLGALLPVIAAIGAAVAVVYVAKKLDAEITERETQVAGAWKDMVQDLVEEEKSAAQIADEHAAARGRANKEYEKAPWYAKEFIDQQKILHAGDVAVNDALLATARTFEEYSAAAQLAGLTTAEEAEALWKASQATDDIGLATQDAIRASGEYNAIMETGVLVMSKAEFQARQTAIARREEQEGFRRDSIAHAEAVTEMAASMEVLVLAEDEAGVAAGVVADMFGNVIEQGSGLVGSFGPIINGIGGVADAFGEAAYAIQEYSLDAYMAASSHFARQAEDNLKLGEKAEDIEQGHLDRLAEIQEKGKSKAIAFNERAEQDKLQKMQNQLAVMHQQELEFTDKTKESTRMAKANAIAELEGHIVGQETRLDNYYAGRLVKQGANIAAELAAEQTRYEEEQADLEKAKVEQEAAQREATGRLLLQQFESWAEMSGVPADEMIDMKMAIMEEYGLVDEGTRAFVDEAMSTWNEWASGLGLSTDDAIQHLEEFAAMINELPEAKTVRLNIESDLAAWEAAKGAQREARGEETGKARLKDLAVTEWSEATGVPVMQHGKAHFSGGLALFEGKGPELAWLPRGSRVWGAAETGQIMGGDSVHQSSMTNNLGGNTYNIYDRDAMLILEERERRDQRAAFSRGM